MIECSVFPTFLFAGIFWLRKLTRDPHIFAHVSVYSVSGRKAPTITKVYLRTDFR